VLATSNNTVVQATKMGPKEIQYELKTYGLGQSRQQNITDKTMQKITVTNIAYT
jgi:hypothetical protein